MFEDFFYSGADGLKLHARLYGRDHDALPLVCLPGLTRNARDFHELAVHLSSLAAKPQPVIAFDYRGRGLSAHDRDWRNYDVMVEARDIIDGLAAMGVEHAAFAGTSRGGLIIMVLAAVRPALLRAAILNDIGPVIEGAGLAQIRAYLERAPKPSSIAEAISIQRATLGQAFSALGDADWERLVRTLYSEDKGRLTADFDPALIRTVTEVDLSRPLPVLWPQFAGLAAIPVMAIRGANSMLLSAVTLEEMARRHPRLEAVTVEGQGHAPLLETGDLPERIATFLERAERARS